LVFLSLAVLMTIYLAYETCFQNRYDRNILPDEAMHVHSEKIGLTNDIGNTTLGVRMNLFENRNRLKRTTVPEHPRCQSPTPNGSKGCYASRCCFD
jgi:hypothetical protein